MLSSDQVEQRLTASRRIMDCWRSRGDNPSFEVHCASQCFIPGKGFDSQKWFKEASTEATSMLRRQPDLFAVDKTGLISFTTTLRGGGHAKETLIALLARVDPSTQDIADFVVLLDPTV